MIEQLVAILIYNRVSEYTYKETVLENTGILRIKE